MIDSVVLLACLASTLYMTGVIAVVQWVYYPLFERIEPSAFRRYHAEHVRRMTYIVFAPMVIELASSGWLAFWPPRGSGRSLAVAGLLAASLTWAVTAGVSVPLHNRLAEGFEAASHRALVRTNAARAAAWIIHSVVVLIMAARSIR
jgi:hypothetical protein